MRLIEYFKEKVSCAITSDNSTKDLQRTRDEYSEELMNNKALGVLSTAYYQGALRAIEAELVKRCNESEVN